MGERRRKERLVSAIQADWIELAEEGSAVRHCLAIAEQDLSGKIIRRINHETHNLLVTEIDKTIDFWIDPYRYLPWAIDLAEELKRRVKSDLKHRAHRWLN